MIFLVFRLFGFEYRVNVVFFTLDRDRRFGALRVSYSGPFPSLKGKTFMRNGFDLDRLSDRVWAAAQSLPGFFGLGEAPDGGA